jgi:PAS domain S-box-containing protein
VISAVKILLVGDTPGDVSGLAAVLGAPGIQAVRARSGDDAVRRVAEEDFAAILLSVDTPTSGGTHTAQRIRACPRSRSTPIIFVAASDMAPRPADEAGRIDMPLAGARLFDIFNQAPAFMCVLGGPEHVFEMANERYVELVGDRALVGKRLVDALPEVKEQGFIALLDNVYRTGEPYSGWNVRVLLERSRGRPREERFVDFVYTALRDDGAPRGILVHGVDITPRLRAEQAVREGEERYRTLFESMDEGFCVIEVLFDRSGQAFDYRFLEINPAFEEQTGLTQAVGKTVLELAPGHEQHWFEIYGDVARTGTATRFVQEAQALGRWFDVYATRVGGPASAKVAVLFTDITARKRADDQLHATLQELGEADRQKNEFLATLAHELRNPLAPLQNGLHLLQLSSGNEERLTQAREMMERQLAHLVHLVNDLLDIARITSGKIEMQRAPVELHRIVKVAVEACTPLLTARAHALQVAVGDPGLVLNVDRDRIVQVLVNLLTNAAKYTPDGGRIALTASTGNGRLAITMTDNGVGIAADSLPRIFDLFNQVRRRSGGYNEGLGIGLTLVKRLVELHGGEVDAASAGEGMGSTFTVRLPLFDAADAPGDAGAAPDRMAPGTREPLKVLVVDDNVDSAQSLAMVLDLSGHDTRVAHTGASALVECRSFRPEVVILDVGLPDQTGYAVATEIRRERALDDTVLIALTGWGTDADRAQAMAAGFDHHVTKPADLSVVTGLLAKIAAARDAR